MSKPGFVSAVAVCFMSSLVTGVGASNMLELGAKPKETSILAIGTVPVQKKIPLSLGGLRTEEAALPPLPLTREERMALRAKHAASRQRAVTNARRTNRKKKPGLRSKRHQQKPVAVQETNEDIVLFDEFGKPSIE